MELHQRMFGTRRCTNVRKGGKRQKESPAPSTWGGDWGAGLRRSVAARNVDDLAAEAGLIDRL